MENIDAFVQVNPHDPRYFSLSNGQPYLPIGLNLCFVRFTQDEAEGLARYEQWIKALAANGGNFIRLWLGHPFFDVEHARSGQYNAEKARRLDAVLAMARQYDLRVKLCLEFFRTLEAQPPIFTGATSFGKPLHQRRNGGPAEDMSGFLREPGSRAQFLRKLDWYAKRYAHEPDIFGWELWNEIDSVSAQGWEEWTAVMLPEVKRRFPRHLAMQSMGSFDRTEKLSMYTRMVTLPGNEVAQVHRYLDGGAADAICGGPMDILAADAVQKLRAPVTDRPILLAEVGAVEPHHAGPFKLYPRDTDGVLLHDLLFAPFFAGAAGPGHAWHWDYYVDQNQLWHHFARFASAVQGIDPAEEQFEALMLPHPRLRVYVLRGKQTLLAWCRDAKSDWQSELVEGQPPAPVAAASLDLNQLAAFPDGTRVQHYDPWCNAWLTGTVQAGQIALPAFHRSLVVRISRSPL